MVSVIRTMMEFWIWVWLDLLGIWIFWDLGPGIWDFRRFGISEGSSRAKAQISNSRADQPRLRSALCSRTPSMLGILRWTINAFAREYSIDRCGPFSQDTKTLLRRRVH